MTVLNQPCSPLDEVEDIERHEKEFTLLRGVDPLMIHHITVDPARVARPERPEQIHAISLRNQPAFYYHFQIIVL